MLALRAKLAPKNFRNKYGRLGNPKEEAAPPLASGAHVPDAGRVVQAAVKQTAAAQVQWGSHWGLFQVKARPSDSMSECRRLLRSSCRLSSRLSSRYVATPGVKGAAGCAGMILRRCCAGTGLCKGSLGQGRDHEGV